MPEETYDFYPTLKQAKKAQKRIQRKLGYRYSVVVRGIFMSDMYRVIVKEK